MHYYQKHIGDFNNATRHLTRVERSLYSDAIELYYETEKPLTNDFERLCKLLLAVTDEEKTALKSILSEFFTGTENGYFNKRCNEEIVKYQSFINSRSRAGKASAEKRINTCSTRVQHKGNTRATNHKPITNNQQPITNNQDKDISANADNAKPKKTTEKLLLMDYGVDEELADDFLKLRKSKRAPITKTVCKQLQNEAIKAGIGISQAVEICIGRNWQNFNASWDWQNTKPINGTKQRPMTFEEIRQENNRIAGEQFLASFKTIDGEVVK